MENITIQYPQVHLGTEKTAISFFESIKDCLKATADTTKKILYVTDKNIFAIPEVKAFLDNLDSENHFYYILDSGESFKTIDSVLAILKTALDKDFQRNSMFIGIGGGVITDMTALASSLFKRGAQLALVPTTILAMGDAALGGKTGCDFYAYKNMIGTFYPAKALYVSTEFIASLPENEFKSGMAEVIKTALLYDKELTNLLVTEYASIKNRNTTLLTTIIRKCMQAKGAIVEQDLTESHLRMQLNLGHTFGHALETKCGLGAITHGEGVAWGMARAVDLSFAQGFCSEEFKTLVYNLLEQYDYCTQKRHPKLPKEVTKNDLLMAMKKDKKNASSKIRFVLQKNIADTIITEIEDSAVLEILA